MLVHKIPAINEIKKQKKAYQKAVYSKFQQLDPEVSSESDENETQLSNYLGRSSERCTKAVVA